MIYSAKANDHGLEIHLLGSLHHTTIFFTPNSSPISRQYHSYSLVTPFARTSVYQSLFPISCTHLWNHLASYLIPLFVLCLPFHLSIGLKLLYFLIIVNYCMFVTLAFTIPFNYCTCCSVCCCLAPIVLFFFLLVCAVLVLRAGTVTIKLL